MNDTRAHVNGLGKAALPPMPPWSDTSYAIAVLDVDGRILCANVTALELTGYRLNEILDRPSSMFIDDEDDRESRHHAQLWERLRAGEPVDGEFKRIGKDGRTFWIEASYNPIFDEDGTLYRVVACSQDVTARHSNDARVAGESSAVRRAMGVVHFTSDGIIVDANENYSAIVGYSYDELVGHHHSHFVDPALAASADYRAFWERLARGEVVAAKVRRIAKDGRPVWLQASYNPLIDEDGRVTRVVKLATDITSDHVASTNHRHQIEAIGRSQAVIHFSLDGNVLWANDKYLTCLGYTLDEITGRHHAMFVEESFRDSPAYAAFWARLNAGEHVAAECRRVGKDGRIRHLSAIYTPLLDDDGRPFMVVTFATDVTYRRRSALQVSSARRRVMQHSDDVRTARGLRTH